MFCREEQLGQVEAAKQAAVTKADEALAAVLAALPAHCQDLTLIEALDKAIGLQTFDSLVHDCVTT